MHGFAEVLFKGHDFVRCIHLLSTRSLCEPSAVRYGRR